LKAKHTDDADKSLPLGPAICEVPPSFGRGRAGLRSAMTQLGMSARAFHRTRSVKLARTIANLEGAAEIQTRHPGEAIHYRLRRQI